MKKIFVCLLLFAIFAGLILYRRHEQISALNTDVGLEALQVETLSLVWTEFQDTVRFSANIEPEEKAAVVGKTPGRTILEVFVKEGDLVKKGQKLATLDDSLARQQALQAEAAVGKAVSYASTVRADQERLSRLFREKAVSKQQLDHIASESKVAARQEQEARAALAQARILLSYHVIEAPISGTLLRREIDPGDTIGAGPAFVISRQDRVKVTGGVPELQYPAVKVGQKIVITADAFPGREFAAAVSRVHPSLDPTTRTGKVEALLDSEGLLKPGMFARATIALQKRAGYALPLESVGQLSGTGERICYVVSADQAILRKVSLGAEQDGMVEVLSGLASGDRVIAVRSEKLRDGVPVRVN